MSIFRRFFRMLAPTGHECAMCGRQWACECRYCRQPYKIVCPECCPGVAGSLLGAPLSPRTLEAS